MNVRMNIGTLAPRHLEHFDVHLEYCSQVQIADAMIPGFSYSIQVVIDGHNGKPFRRDASSLT